ncbi:MAG: hypothetical protein ACRDL4_02225 [Thermoleophilaceae bacterium]
MQPRSCPLVAYQGLRIPEEVLALEVRHVRANTLLIEQRNLQHGPGHDR